MEQFDRFELLVGKDNFKKIQDLNILVVGVGGVGSYVVESLVRSGVNNISLVDFDKIDITNLNRQIMTDLTNIGEYKADVLKQRINNINKECNVKIINDFIDENNIDILFKDSYDYIIDSCDTIKTKELIIKRCLENNIKFITCCGTGNKLDPSKLEITDIRKTSYDPLAKILRKYVKDNNLKGKIMCCWSKEMPLKINNNVIASNAFVPSTAGLLITSYVINDILKSNN